MATNTRMNFLHLNIYVLIGILCDRVIEFYTPKAETFISLPSLFQLLIRDSITNGLERTLSTGNWDLKRFKMHRKGMTQVACHFPDTILLSAFGFRAFYCQGKLMDYLTL